jgi:hypothetical protein
VLSLWLALCLVEPMQLHTCAMHGGLAIQQSHGRATHAHAAAHHQMGAQLVGHTHNEQSDNSQSPQCSCLGDCNGGSAPVGLVAAAIAISAHVTTGDSYVAFEYKSPALAATHFLRPFANGPPLASSRA